jgi:hypothetical protein
LVFGSRIFDNLSTIRRYIVTNMRNKKRGKWIFLWNNLVKY